jgi:hypothetical protein
MNYRTAFLLSWAALGVFAAGMAVAVTTGPWSPDTTPGCRIVDSTPSYSAGQLVAVTCNTSGQLRVTTTP